jgi:hypothetical protein
MKKTIVVSLLIFLGLTVAAQSKNEKAIAAATESLRKAMVDADSVMLDKLTSEKLTYGHSGGHVEGKQEFISKIVTGKSVFVTMELSEQTISVSKNIAMVRHKLHAMTNDNGKPGEVHLLVLLIWQKLHGNWKLVARQAVKPQ